MFLCIQGLWSSPSDSGSRPPPCSDFSLTMSDEDQTVVLGGYTSSGMSSEALVLHLPTIVSHFGLSSISYVARLKKEDKTELMDKYLSYILCQDYAEGTLSSRMNYFSRKSLT